MWMLAITLFAIFATHTHSSTVFQPSVDNKKGSLGEILEGMKQILDFAQVFTGSLTQRNRQHIKCPVLRCSTDSIPRRCRRSVIYNYKGKRCNECDIDVCQFHQKQSSMVLPARSPQAQTILTRPTQNNLRVLPIEDRWLRPIEPELFDTANHLNVLSGSLFVADDARTFPSRDSDFPKGWENSWITSPMFMR